MKFSGCSGRISSRPIPFPHRPAWLCVLLLENDMRCNAFAVSMMAATVVGLSVLLSSGCRHHHNTTPSPAMVGLNTRDLVEPIGQKEADELIPTDQLLVVAEQLRKER